MRTSRRSCVTPPRAATSSGSTWRTRTARPTPSACTASCARPVSTTSAIVLQAYLRRTIRDIRELAPYTPNVRLCKGIYVEPPLIAYQGYEEVRENFVRSLDELLRAGSYVGVATHDKFLISEGLRLVQEHGLSTRAVRVPDAARRDAAMPATGSSATVIACACTSPSGDSGTATRFAACRRTRRSPAISRPTRSAACSPGRAVSLGQVAREPKRTSFPQPCPPNPSSSAT